MAFLPGNGTVVLTTGFINATSVNYSHEDDCRHQPSAISEYRSEIAVKQHLQFVTAYQPPSVDDVFLHQHDACNHTTPGHTDWINSLSTPRPFPCLRTTASTDLPVGLPLHHEKYLDSAALSPDGKVLAAACQDENAYTRASLEDLLPSTPNVPTRKLLMNSNDTRCPPIQARRIPQGFFDGMQNGAQSSTARGTQAHLLERFVSVFRDTHADGAIELQQRPTRSIFSCRPPIVEASAVQDEQSLFVARRPERDKGSSTTPSAPGTTAATPGARPTHSRFVQLLAHLVLFLVLFLCCTSTQRAGINAQPTQIQLQGQAQIHATSSQPKHYQGQSQGPPQAQASSSQTQPTAHSTSTTPTVPDAHTTAPGAARVQPRPPAIADSFYGP
ncbi:hypothetical protein CY34DRAFT_14707 [Suillus luteus UH-Slu-Lm8-n1]|uniref:Uncharacterized protein n=1 Tax=Suillus luteus UH-Slu-Lm8-n1 TaxID=930992 RepID=A0A0D0B562_9AGAM|nr:hypothetical protein CY34DRAFT_14707 [Suillus luteus UH-Slu-Lm8-n1]